MNDTKISEIIEMAWCDDTSFDDIEALTGLAEKEVIALMRENMKASSFRMWRKRVSGRTSKHDAQIKRASSAPKIKADDFL